MAASSLGISCDRSTTVGVGRSSVEMVARRRDASALQLEREAKSETALAIIFMMIDSVGVVSKRTSKNYESMVA